MDKLIVCCCKGCWHGRWKRNNTKIIQGKANILRRCFFAFMKETMVFFCAHFLLWLTWAEILDGRIRIEKGASIITAWFSLTICSLRCHQSSGDCLARFAKLNQSILIAREPTHKTKDVSSSSQQDWVEFRLMTWLNAWFWGRHSRRCMWSRIWFLLNSGTRVKFSWGNGVCVVEAPSQR